MVLLSKEQIENLPDWIPIEGFPKYEVNCREGIVKSLYTLKVLKPSLSRGYPYVGLYKDRKLYIKQVHRIVATAAFGYHNIPTDGLLVMHLDEERHNPRIDNLAIGTNKENLNFPKAKQRFSESKKGKSFSEGHRKKLSEAMKGKRPSKESRMKMSDAQQKKRVGAYKDGVLTLIFNSVRLTKVYGFNASAVCKCCKGKQKSHKSLEWKYIK